MRTFSANVWEREPALSCSGSDRCGGLAAKEEADANGLADELDEKGLEVLLPDNELAKGLKTEDPDAGLAPKIDDPRSCRGSAAGVAC